MQKSNLLKKLIFHAVVLTALAFVLLFLDICPIKSIIGIPCPTCGMTRSLQALLNLDFRLSFYYNPMTIPFCLVLWFAIHKDMFKMGKKTKDIILIVSAVVIFTVYITRLIMNNFA